MEMGKIGLGLVFVASCAYFRAEPEPGTTTTNAASIGPAKRSSDVMAAALCNRAARCGEIGLGRSHASMEQCMLDETGHVASEMARLDCTRGIELGELDACASAIRTQACTTTALAAPACQASSLCVARRTEERWFSRDRF